MTVFRWRREQLGDVRGHLHGQCSGARLKMLGCSIVLVGVLARYKRRRGRLESRRGSKLRKLEAVKDEISNSNVSRQALYVGMAAVPPAQREALRGQMHVIARAAGFHAINRICGCTTGRQVRKKDAAWVLVHREGEHDRLTVSSATSTDGGAGDGLTYV